MSFNIEKFLSDCTSITTEPTDTSVQRKISELLGRVVSDPKSVFKVLGNPNRAKYDKLYVSKELTVINLVWAPRMTLLPHNHNMWAVIGVYSGREDNIFWRRIKGVSGSQIEAAGAKSIGPREVYSLGKNIIHSVTNPTPRFTGAIHIYGGDFFATERSEWNPETLEEQCYDMERNMQLFEEENSIFQLRCNLKIGG